MALDPSRTIRHDQPLQAIGMDSMMAVMLRNMLQVSTDLQLPSSFAFQHPTIASIAQFLETMLWSEDRAAPGNAPDSIREEIRL
jgi:acyl carrier protein